MEMTQELRNHIALKYGPEDFAKAMKDIENKYEGEEKSISVEEMHREMDELLCKTLRNLGFGEGIDIYEQNPKWYA